MSDNTGTAPRSERVDVKLRNGWVVRSVEPSRYRWKAWPEGESLGDILSWQITA